VAGDVLGDRAALGLAGVGREPEVEAGHDAGVLDVVGEPGE
jgi:hypothetical protein